MTSEQTPSAAEDCDTVKSRLKTNLDGSVILLIPRKIIIYYYANVSAGHMFFFFSFFLQCGYYILILDCLNYKLQK